MDWASTYIMTLNQILKKNLVSNSTTRSLEFLDFIYCARGGDGRYEQSQKVNNGPK